MQKTQASEPCRLSLFSLWYCLWRPAGCAKKRQPQNLQTYQQSEVTERKKTKKSHHRLLAHNCLVVGLLLLVCFVRIALRVKINCDTDENEYKLKAYN